MKIKNLSEAVNFFTCVLKRGCLRLFKAILFCHVLMKYLRKHRREWIA